MNFVGYLGRTFLVYLAVGAGFGVGAAAAAVGVVNLERKIIEKSDAANTEPNE